MCVVDVCVGGGGGGGGSLSKSDTYMTDLVSVLKLHSPMKISVFQQDKNQLSRFLFYISHIGSCALTKYLTPH